MIIFVQDKDGEVKFLVLVGYHTLFVIVSRSAHSAVKCLNFLQELFAFETCSVNYCSDFYKISTKGFETVVLRRWEALHDNLPLQTEVIMLTGRRKGFYS